MRLLLRALRWRAAASVATALLAAVTVLGAVVGPLWTRAGSESVLRDGLTEFGVSQDSAQYSAQGAPTTGAFAVLDEAVKAVDLDHHGPPIHGLKLLSDMSVADSRTPYRAPLLWREGFCQQVVVVSGRCPTAAGEVMVHRAAAAQMGLGNGTTLNALVQGLGSSSPDLPLTETVVGRYLPKDQHSPYWAGESETAFITSVAHEEGLQSFPDRVPATLTVPATFQDLAVTYVKTGEPPGGFATVTRVLDVGSLRLADVPAFRTSLARAKQVVATRSTNDQVTALTDNVTDALDSADNDGKQLGRASTVVLAQLVLLAGVVLLLVISSSAAARAPEVAAARLRGLRTRTVVGLAIAEPLVLVVIGTPIGALLAFALAKAMAAERLVPGTPVAVSWGALQALLVALAVLVVAVLLVCGRELGKPVLELWQRTDKPPSRFAFGAEIVLALALGGAALACTRSGEPWVLLTPVPVSLGVALLGLRALPLVFAPSLRRTRGRRRLAGFLAVRQLVRRREGAWLTGLLVVAFGLAATATTAWSVANRAATVRANAEVGAPVVLSVQPDAKHADLDLRAVVRKADPTGTRAMAVIEYLPYASDVGRYLAVDTDRLKAVASWDDTLSGATVDQVVTALRVPKGQYVSAVITDAVSVDPRAVLAPNTPRGGAVVTGVDGIMRPVLVRRTVTSLPRGLLNATMVDFDVLQTVPSTRIVSTYEVWMKAGDRALQKRLEAAGLQVLETDDAGEHRTLLTRQGPALAVLLSLVAAVIALLLAAATTLFSVLTNARRRGWELAALGALGVPSAILRRASRAESLLLLVAGLGLGVIAGAIAGAMTLPYLPLFSDDTEVSVPLTPGVLSVVGLLAVAVALAIGTSGLVGRVLQKAADPTRLREVQA